MGTITPLERLFITHTVQPIPSIRAQCLHAQHGRCVYCETPMWLRVRGLYDIVQSARPFMKLYDIPYTQAKPLLCTIEHLIGRKDGGVDHLDNIAVACLQCNSKRFGVNKNITPEDYKKLVHRHMKWGVWFDFPVHDIFEYTYTQTFFDKLIGGVIKYYRKQKSGVNHLRNTIRRGKYPKQMSLMQCIYSTIRLHFL